MSIEIALIESLRSPSSSKNACKIWALRPGRLHTIRPRKYGLGHSWWEYHTTGAFSATTRDDTWKLWVARLL
jgi:hypothetical protein